MKAYERPMVEVLDETSEGVYTISGDVAQEEQEEKVKCRFGRSEANAGSDTCQACSASGGLRANELDGESLFKEDFKGCIDGMPLK